MTKKLLAGLSGTLLALSLLAGITAAPAGATWRPSPPTQTITDIVVASGGEFDRNPFDYDILLNAVVTAGLAETLATPGLDVTVWAPNDAAFIRTARDLGFTGRDEAGAWAFLVEALTDLGGGDPIPLLTEILTYHVTPGARGVVSVLTTTTFPTLQGGTITRHGFTLQDAAPSLRDPKLTFPLQVRASNGIIHTIDRVLIPVAL
jgi:serralysin